jgi:lipoate-protein ligase A
MDDMRQSCETWRLLNDWHPLEGAVNMAVDEMLLEAVARPGALPVLRVYAWQPPCLSLGYGQPWADVDVAAAEARGWHVVRRPTGGRAILHTDELTYSLALPAEHPLALGTIVESYRRISQALLAALHTLGAAAFEAEPHPPEPAGGVLADGVCFRVPSHYEITVGGRKLIGSAQVRRRGGVLQHGSLPLGGDLARICDVLAYANDAARAEAAARLHARALTLETALGHRVLWEQAASAVISAFAHTFGIAFQPRPLTADERAHAHAIAARAYADPAYTARR